MGAYGKVNWNDNRYINSVINKASNEIVVITGAGDASMLLSVILLITSSFMQSHSWQSVAISYQYAALCGTVHLSIWT